MSTRRSFSWAAWALAGSAALALARPAWASTSFGTAPREHRRASRPVAHGPRALSRSALADPGLRIARPDSPVATAVERAHAAEVSPFFPPEDLGRGGPSGPREARASITPLSVTPRYDAGPRGREGGASLASLPLGSPSYGGGPRTGGPVVLDPSQVLRIDSQDVVPGPRSLTLGCTRIGAVSTPAVRALSLSVDGPDGARVATSRGRDAHTALTLCAREAGTYRVRVRMEGGPQDEGVTAARLFVEQ